MLLVMSVPSQRTLSTQLRHPTQSIQDAAILDTAAGELETCSVTCGGHRQRLLKSSLCVIRTCEISHHADVS